PVSEEPALERSEMGILLGAAPPDSWLDLLAREAQVRLLRNEPAVMATLTRDFERALLETALGYSRGRRMEAAQRLGIGRNTLTRKCAELGLNETDGG